jgi:alpha-amylase/alpha-mannosidase (GH57 family)
MPHPLYVAFVWHQHQPLYKSYSHVPPGASEPVDDNVIISNPSLGFNNSAGVPYRLPWVRLHGVKDYLDLILMLARYPQLHQTVNLVPSLILQLDDYAAGVAVDPYLALTLTPTDRLTVPQKRFIIRHFFDANHHTMIALYNQRQDQGPDWCLSHWSLQDYDDLLAWHNLTWIDPLFRDQSQVAQWFEPGRAFSLSDRQRICSKHRDIISQIIPEHKRLQETGQLEVTISPYTHPILPLLADTDAGRVAVPTMALPQNRFQWPDDIARHLHKAWNLYCDRFGVAPKGLWPSEQSVSPAMLPHVAQQGFQWLCSDEAVLGWTLDHFFHRNRSGTVNEPELLYRPYRLETEHGNLAIVFRDHRLSDLIGFTYGSMPAQKAAADLVGHLGAIADALKQRQRDGSTTEQPWLVTIALDGENCWEFYQHDGQPFLEALYQSFSATPDLKLVTVSEFVQQFPPTQVLSAQTLHSGSWIDGSFTTWMGDPAKNRAWEYLAAARQVLADHPEATETTNPAAWEALYAAEGSDWFWWFGEGHTSNQDAIFDQLFREHLCTLYQALNHPLPEYLHVPVESHASQVECVPQGFIHPVMDGQGDEQDWESAGRIDIGGARGTMHRNGPIQCLWYGVNHLNFYLRLDFQTGIQPGIDCPPDLHLLWLYPDRTLPNSPIPLGDVPNHAPVNYLYHHHLGIHLPTGSTWFQEAEADHHWGDRVSQAQVKLARCLEIAVPWKELNGVAPEWQLRVLLVFSESGQFREYLPDHALIALEMP